MQLRKAIDLFLDGYFSTCQRSEKTIKAYTIDLEQFRRFVGGRPPLEKIGADHLESWAAQLRSLGYASASIRRKFAALKVFFNYWFRRGMIEQSPIWRIHLDLAPEKVLTRVLRLDDIKKLIKQAKIELGNVPRKPTGLIDSKFLSLRNRAIIEVLFTTGLRVGELSTLRISDYQQEEDTLTVAGKGARQRLAILPDKNSSNTCRIYLTHRAQIQVATDRLFINHQGSPISTQSIGCIISRVAQRAGIEQRVTPHMLRHTVATLLLRNGADIRIVQEFLGHASITTTQRYTHINKADLSLHLNQFHPNFTNGTIP